MCQKSYHLYFQRSCTFLFDCEEFLKQEEKKKKKKKGDHYLFQKAKKWSQGHSGNSKFSKQMLHVMKSMLFFPFSFSLLHVFILSKPGWWDSQYINCIIICNHSWSQPSKLIIHRQQSIKQPCLILASIIKRPLLGGGLSTYRSIYILQKVSFKIKPHVNNLRHLSLSHYPIKNIFTFTHKQKERDSRAIPISSINNYKNARTNFRKTKN